MNCFYLDAITALCPHLYESRKNNIYSQYGGGGSSNLHRLIGQVLLLNTLAFPQLSTRWENTALGKSWASRKAKCKWQYRNEIQDLGPSEKYHERRYMGNF